jgi:hypothetical protein
MIALKACYDKYTVENRRKAGTEVLERLSEQSLELVTKKQAETVK